MLCHGVTVALVPWLLDSSSLIYGRRSRPLPGQDRRGEPVRPVARRPLEPASKQTGHGHGHGGRGGSATIPVTPVNPASSVNAGQSPAPSGPSGAGPSGPDAPPSETKKVPARAKR